MFGSKISKEGGNVGEVWGKETKAKENVLRRKEDTEP